MLRTTLTNDRMVLHRFLSLCVCVFSITDAAPGYTDRILFPIDLGLIRKMITTKIITNYAELHQRIGLICHNCVKFNGRCVCGSVRFRSALWFDFVVTEKGSVGLRPVGCSCFVTLNTDTNMTKDDNNRGKELTPPLIAFFTFYSSQCVQRE